MPGTRPSRWEWLIAAIPVCVVLVVFVTWLPPRDTSTYVSLDGPWLGVDVTAEDAQARLVQVGAEDFKPLQVPGYFLKQGFEGHHLVLRRDVELPAALHGPELVLTVGYVHRAIFRVYVNGTLIGGRGEPSTRFLGSDTELSAFTVAPELLVQGQNRIALEVLSFERLRNGIVDTRTLLGRSDVLIPWHYTQATVRAALEAGGALVLASFLALVLVLWRIQGERANRTLLRSTVVLLFTALWYTSARTGLLAAAHLPVNLMHRLSYLSVLALGLGALDFVEDFFLGRVTLLRKVNRVLSWPTFALGVGAAFISLDALIAVYGVYIRWLFIVLTYSVGLAVRALVIGGKRFGTVVTSSVGIAALSGINDLLADLGIINSPRLFSLGIFVLGSAAAVVVVAEFVEISNQNRALTSSLVLKNDQLSIALQQANESAQAKSDFLSSTSHELRTPLNSIINIPQGLLEDLEEPRGRCTLCQTPALADSGPCPSCGGPLAVDPSAPARLGPQKSARLLRSVVLSGQHLLALVNDILDFSKLDAQRLVLHRVPTPVSALLDELRLAMEPVAEQARVSLVVEPPASVTAEVDPQRVQQVLLNLVSNAIKFSDGKGEVRLTSKVEDGRLLLTVKDQGIGIDPAHHAVIFESFRQVQGGSTRRYGGTGLGLAISRRLVELHGGTLTVASALGQGSTFTVALPVQPG